MSLTFSALEIGKGDAFLLENNGWYCLFDAGGSGNRVKTILKRKKIKKLDLAICSHNDEDHANGFIKLLEKDSKIEIKEIWLPYWWASILQYAEEHHIDWSEIECFNEELNEIVKNEYRPDLLYSDEQPSLSTEAFNYKTLPNLADHKLGDFENKYELRCNRIRDEIYHLFKKEQIDLLLQDFGVSQEKLYEVTEYIARKVSKRVTTEIFEFSEEEIHILTRHIVYDFIHDFISKYVPIRVYFSLRRLKSLLSHIIDYHIDKFCFQNRYYATHGHSEEFKFSQDLKIKFNRIMEIAILANQRGCVIRWFEPYSGSGKSIPIDYGFYALSSVNKCQVKRLKNTMALFYALSLSIENQYSLVFEYHKDNVPVIRFSADSDCYCQSFPYKNNIIVTAPHHGSEANAVVYNKLKGDDIIWVRSDSLGRTQGRPCNVFKSLKNKYCLACKHRNPDKREISFLYNANSKKWELMEGLCCIC